MNAIQIGLIDDSVCAANHLAAALPGFQNRCSGRPIALAEAFAQPVDPANVDALIDRIANARGPVLLFVDLNLGLSGEARAALAERVRALSGRAELDKFPEGALVAAAALLNRDASPLMLVHNTPHGDADMFGLLTEFGTTCRPIQHGRRTDFACLLRPTDFLAPALSDPRASVETTAKLIEWSVGEFRRRLPWRDHTETAPLLAAWTKAMQAIDDSGWFDTPGADRLFNTRVSMIAGGPVNPGTSHDLVNWHPEFFRSLDRGSALDTLRPLFGALDIPPDFPGTDDLAAFWPLSCLKTISHNLPHRALLFAAVNLQCPGMLATPAEHRREIRLRNVGTTPGEAATRVLAALHGISEAFQARPPEVFQVGEREHLRLVFTSEQAKVEDIALAAVTHTVDGKQKGGHPSGGSFTHCCEWLGRYATNFWVGRVREDRGKRELRLAVEFEERRLQ